MTTLTYSIYSNGGIDRSTGDRMYLILTDNSANIVTNLKATNIKVTGAKSADTSALSGGMLILNVKTGGIVTVTVNGRSFALSQPFGIPVAPIAVR